MKKSAGKGKKESPEEKEFGMEKNWKHPCDVCESLPTVGKSGLCGPCCFGEAATAGGNW